MSDEVIGPRVVEGFPTLTSLTSHLEPWRGARAVVVSTSGAGGRALGNNGDDLMHAVFHRILEQLGIETVDTAPDVVIVPPSGALLQVYSFPRYLAERLRGHESVPVVVFPSSAYFPSEDPSYIFAGRGAETLLFVRESGSKEHLQDQWGDVLNNVGVQVVLDHDVVASGHEFVPSILGTSRGGDINLIAARIDREASPVNARGAAKSGASSALHMVAQHIPYGPVYTRASRIVRAGRNRAAAHRLAARAGVSVDGALCVDISARQFATFAEYRSAILRSQSVITDRLHVALPAAIMGKSVTMIEAGYFKLGGVYRRSLRDVPNVRLLPEAGR